MKFLPETVDCKIKMRTMSGEFHFNLLAGAIQLNDAKAADLSRVPRL